MLIISPAGVGYSYMRITYVVHNYDEYLQILTALKTNDVKRITRVIIGRRYLILNNQYPVNVALRHGS